MKFTKENKKKMKRNKNSNALTLVLLVILSLTFIGAASAQSADQDNPTALTTNIIEGEGDGKAETVYYSFTATKGDVKVTVDAKTDDRSTPLRVTLMDEDGKELLPLYVVAKGTGQREVGTKRFVRETKVVVRIRMDDDPQVNLLTYKIKLDGAVQVEAPPVVSDETPASDETTSTPPTEQTTSTETPATSGIEQTTTKSGLADKLKKKLKKEAKKVVENNLNK